MIGSCLLAGYWVLVGVLAAYLLCFLAVSLRRSIRPTTAPGYPLGKQERISIIIPVANEQSIISRCLDSILRHDLSRVDLVIVAINGSMDRTETIVDNYAAHHPMIRRIVLQESSKVDAMLAAMRLAPNRHVLLIDADVDLAHDAISRLAQFHFESRNDASTCLIDPLTQDAPIPKLISCDRLFRAKILNLARDWWKMSHVPGNLFLVDKLLYARLMSKDTMLSDNEFTYRLWREGRGISCLPEVLAYERERLTLLNLVRQRKRWVLGNIDTMGTCLAAIAALPLDRGLVAVSYPLLWYGVHYALALGSLAALLRPDWRMAYGVLVLVYGLCVAASLWIKPTEHTRAFTSIDAAVHCLVFPWAVTWATVLAFFHLMRDARAFQAERNGSSFARDALLPEVRV